MVNTRPAKKTWFHRIVLKRRWVTFVVMGAAFLLFGAGTLNLLSLLRANAELLATHGWVAVMDGALFQLVELLITGYLSMAAYVIFKGCEYALVHALNDAPMHAADGAPAPPAAAAVSDEVGAGSENRDMSDATASGAPPAMIDIKERS